MENQLITPLSSNSKLNNTQTFHLNLEQYTEAITQNQFLIYFAFYSCIFVLFFVCFIIWDGYLADNNCSQSHLPIELEQGTLDLNAIRPTNDILPDERATLSANVADVVHSADTQILPNHLKCGMWASLALATVFLAGI